MAALLQQYYHKIITNFWDQRWTVISLGILSALYFGSLGIAWAVTGEFTRWGAHLVQWLGGDISGYSYLNLIHFSGTPLTRPDGVMVIGMFVGAFSSALFGQNFKIRFPRWQRIVQGVCGGILAGFGTRLAMGCNLAALFTGIPQFSFHAWLFTLGTIIGTYVGVKLTLTALFKGSPKVLAASEFKMNVSNSRYYRWQPVLGWLVVALFIISLVNAYSSGLSSPLTLACTFGFAFGFLIQKGQVCFTSAFRDLWLVGRTTMAKALVWGILVQSLISLVFIFKGVPPTVIWWAGPGALLGGVLFGVGIVIAGGCETGWMYRSVEGQVQFWFVGLGNVIGATLLFMLWDRGLYAALVAPYPRVDLVKDYGFAGGLAITAILLFIWYAWVDWREKARYRLIQTGGRRQCLTKNESC